MRIISKFKDYYDTCLAHGADKSLIYKRVNKSGVLNKSYHFDRDIFDSAYEIDDFEHVTLVRRMVVGFCGNLYPVVKVRTYNKCSLANPSGKTKSYIIYSIEEFQTHFPKFYNKEVTWAHRDPRKKIDMWFNDLSCPIWGGTEKIDVAAYKRLFIDRKIPLFRVDQTVGPCSKSEITENCSLELCAFYKVFDAFQAFQEIAMYQADSLCDKEDPEMPVGNDVIVARSKGYDKFSFRQDKGTKKNKRKLNKARKRNKGENQ
jgi:hypothetical protein